MDIPNTTAYDTAPLTQSVGVTETLNETINISVDEYNLLLSNLGARYRSQSETITLTVFYCVIFVTGAIGNISTCVVIIKNSYLRNATNYYVFSLAVSDLLTLMIGLPPELHGIWEAYPWRLGEPFCQFKSFITEMTSTASVLTITSFTVERYVAICHPMRSHTMSNLSRAIKIIVLIWIIAGLVVLPVPIHLRTFHVVTVPYEIADSLVCSIPRKWMDHKMNYYFAFSTIVLFILPMTIITALYILIGLALKRSAMTRQYGDAPSTTTTPRYKRTVLKMLDAFRGRRLVRKLSSRIGRSRKPEVHLYLVAVVIAFFVCWAPFHAQRLMTVLIAPTEWTHLLLEIQSQLFYVSGILWFVGSTVNPILYNLMSRKYRQAFKHTLCRCCSKPRQPGQDSRIYMRQYTSQQSETYFTTTGSTRVIPGGQRRSQSSEGEYAIRLDTSMTHRATVESRKKDHHNVYEGGNTLNGCLYTNNNLNTSISPTVLPGSNSDAIELQTLICDTSGRAESQS